MKKTIFIIAISFYVLQFVSAQDHQLVKKMGN